MRNPIFSAAIVVALVGVASAQDPRVTPPETAADYWKIIEFELNTGKYDVAAEYLKKFVASNPADKDLVAIEKDRGAASFLRLRSVKWYADAKQDAAAREVADQLLAKVSAAVKKELTNPERIAKFIKSLRESPEERAYALGELQRSGAVASAQMIETLKNDNDPQARSTILRALPLLFADSVPPILAATDIPDNVLQYELLRGLEDRSDLETLTGRAETDPVPTLDHLAASATSDLVRRKAAEVLSKIRPVPPTRQPLAKVELTRAADRFYRHQASFANSPVTVWRFDGQSIVASGATVSQAEEYYGLRYARWALEIDPAYEPAQTLFLSLATEKAMERAGLEKELSKEAPDVNDLLATVYSGALITALDRALVENRTSVALALTRALGARAEVAAARNDRNRPGVMVRALDYPDRRVALAAADGLLRLPANGVHSAHGRVIEVLRRALAADAGSGGASKGRVIVASFDPMMADGMAAAVRAAGYDSVTVQTGKDLMRRLKASADIDAIIIDADLPYPPLPDTLASLRYDIHLGHLPVRVVYTPQTTGSTYYINNGNRRVNVVVEGADKYAATNDAIAARVRRLTEGYKQTAIVAGPLTPTAVNATLAAEATADQPAGSLPLSATERKAQSQLAIEWLKRIATGEVGGYDARPAEREIRGALFVDELAKTAATTIGPMPIREAQPDLVAVLINTARPADIRAAAADALVQQLQRYGVNLPNAQVKSLVDLLAQTKEKELRGKVAAVVGALKLSSEQAGKRLQDFKTPLPTKDGDK